MPDLRTDPAFNAALDAVKAAVSSLATNGIADAQALIDRLGSVNNLQGHYASILPLAVHLLRTYPAVLNAITSATSLQVGMDGGTTASTREIRHQVWSLVAAHMSQLIRQHGQDIVASEMRSGAPQSVAQIAETYLSTRYGGGQTKGGGGDTVLKRTLKIVAHALRP